MTRLIFDQEMEKLKNNLEEMGYYVESAIDKILEAIENNDSEIAEYIIKNDRFVNDMEKSIEARCLSLITKQQPIAKDLRIVSAALKVVTDIERIGDHAADIAELLIRNKEWDVKRYTAHITPMLEISKTMVHDSIETFLKRDIKEANRVIAKDDEVDELFNKVKVDIINSIRNGEENIDICVDILMLSKYLEKIGDHAVNIAEWKIFKETGLVDDVRLI